MGSTPKRRSSKASGDGEVKGTSRTARTGGAGAGRSQQKGAQPSPRSAARSGAAASGAESTGKPTGKSTRRVVRDTTHLSANSRHAVQTRVMAAGGKSAAGKKVAATNMLNYPRAGKKGLWRWLPSFRLLATACALMILAGVGFSFWLYASTDVPEESAVATAQTTRVYFADGKTEMGSFSDYNRTILPSEQIPQNIKDAVVASEDSTFYENRGISPKGIVRALINNIRGGARQGASTITQQYVERYHTGTNTSYWGKVKEMVMALKIDQELSKDEILTRYLNTIYFGRGAYGVQEAAKAYFGKDAKDLTDEEAALLVAVIPAPSAYDPAKNPQKATRLWDRVISRQVNETASLTRDEAEAMQFPETIEPRRKNVYGGTNGYLLKYIHRELERQGLTEEQIDTGGFTVISTIDRRLQGTTVEAVAGLGQRPERNAIGTVTLDPSSGAIRAMYGGPDYVHQPRNDATQSRMQAGSIFKTFTLIAALEDGQSLHSRWDGNSPKKFRGNLKIKNFNDISYGRVDIEKATTNSINTAFVEMNLEIGPQRTRETAVKLGLPEKTPGLNDDATNVLGSASPTVLEMAGVYQTVATGGVRRTPYMVQKVTGPDGEVRYEHKTKDERVIDEKVAINATVALQGPTTKGSARKLRGIMDGRPVAGKTGTSESFRSAWFVGFTPQLVTAVGMFQPTKDGKGEEPLTPWGGERYISGATFPTELWGAIMAPALEGQEKLDFPEEVRLNNEKKTRDRDDDDDRGSSNDRERPEREPSPTEQPSESPSPSQQPSKKPTESKKPKPSTEPAPSEGPSEEPPEDPGDNERPTKPAPSDQPRGHGSGNGSGRGGGERPAPTRPPGN